MRMLLALPCFNEAGTIADVVASIPNSFDGIDSFDIIVIDDGSTDGTAENAAKAGARVIKHKSNKGLGQAFKSAVDYAVAEKYDLMVNMDGDGQFYPDDIGLLIKPVVQRRADFVTGVRFHGGKRIPNMPALKYFGNKAMNSIIGSLCKEKYADVSCGFRAYSRETLLNINFHGKYTYTQESFLTFHILGLTVSEVPIRVRYFKERKSKIAGSVAKYALKTSGIILSLLRDFYPLYFFGSLSMFFFILGIGFGTIFLTHFIKTGYFSGYIFSGLISAFCVLISTILISFAISMQSFVRLNNNQNRILYLLKKHLL